MSGIHSEYNRVVCWRHAYPHANSQSNGYGDCNRYANRHGYGYSDAETYAHTTFNADPEAAPHSGAEITGLAGFERCI